MTNNSLSGGCQCGAVRFKVSGEPGRSSICHCRMCQKAFGGYFAALVGTKEGSLTWTRGAPSHYQSSNKVKRGFCNKCGSPLTFEHPNGVDLALGAFDQPEKVLPVLQVSDQSETIVGFDDLHKLPRRDANDQVTADEYLSSIISYQHPDHDTDDWPSK